MGILIGLGFMLCTALMPLDVGNLSILHSITCFRETVYPRYGNRDA